MTSFPKAKIHRFNEDISCAPPPGTYDPKLDAKVKGAPILTGKRFPDQQCISSSLDNLDRECQNTQITFRTPQVKRKVALTPKISRTNKFDTPGSSSSTSSVRNDTFNKTPATKKITSSADYQRLEQELCTLAEKHLVEINGLNSEIFKLQNALVEVKKHEADMKLVLEEKSALALERHNEMLKIKVNLDTAEERIQNERENHNKYIEELKEDISKLVAKKEDLEEIIAEKQLAIVMINDKFLNIEKELHVLREENERYKEDIDSIEEKHSELLNRLCMESEEKIGQLEESMKTKVCMLENEFVSNQETAQVQFQTKLNYFMTHEFELKSKAFENQLKMCYTKIKDLRKLVDQNEKEFSESIKEVDERCKLIYRELVKVEKQRDELLQTDLEKKLTIIDIQDKSNCLEEDLNMCKIKCKKYEITLNTMQKTINALGDRLLESENEVIRLNSVEVDLESQKKTLEEKSKILLSDITALREGIERMEKEIICDVTVMRESLAAKVDYFKIEAAKKTCLLNNEIRDKQCTIDKLLNELGDANNVVDELKCIKLNNENQISSLQSKVENYKIILTNTEKELHLLNNEKEKLLDSIDLLKDQIKSSQEVVEIKNKNDVKQQQYIDGLISDLVLEKERCVSLEAEKNHTITELAKLQVSNRQKDQELKELNLKLDSMNRTLKNLEEKVTLIDEDKGILEMQLLNAENNTLELNMANEILSKSNEELKTKLSELQESFTLANERADTETSALERDNVNKAARILELSMNIDTLTETVNGSEVKIACLEAEKISLSMQLDETKTTITELESTLAEKSMVIHTLTEHVKIEKAKYKDYVAETENIFSTLKRHNGVLKINADNGIKLQEAEEKINKLEEELRTAQNKHKKSEVLEMETQKLREEVEVMSLRLQVVSDERNKLDHELAELMGHQNIHQKIKHVNQLKQNNIELKMKMEQLEIENSRLKKKLADFKENANVPRLENSPKVMKNKNKKTCSPAVLKDRNC